MTELELLKAARALIASQPSVTRRVFARNARGEPCPPRDPAAVRFCAVGALDVCHPPNGPAPAIILAYRRLNRLAKLFGYRDTAALNDGAGRPLVLKAYDAAIAELEASA